MTFYLTKEINEFLASLLSYILMRELSEIFLSILKYSYFGNLFPGVGQ
jgi:hypothetical protein